MSGYCTVAELREHLGDKSSTLNQAMVERAIEATSRAIDLYCGAPLRQFQRDDTPTVRRYVADDPADLVVTDISTTTGLTVATDDDNDGVYETTWSASDYQVEPVDGDLLARPWTRLVAVADRTWPVGGRRARVQVTARHGWPAVPADVMSACLIRAAAIFKRKEAIFGSAAMSGFGEVTISRQDPDVAALLYPYVRLTARSP